MSNTLNIDSTLFGNDSNKFFLYSPAMYINLHDGNGTNGLGYLESELSFKAKITPVNFKTGIPKTEIRRDIIDQEFTLEGVLKQLQLETIGLLLQRRYDTSDGTYARIMMGTEIPTPVYPSVILIGQTVDGVELRLYIRKLLVMPEDLDIKMGGDTYSSLPFKGTVQKDDAPTTTNPTWPYNASYANQDNMAFWAVPKTSSAHPTVE
jgi:hypothetical protein